MKTIRCLLRAFKLLGVLAVFLQTGGLTAEAVVRLIDFPTHNVPYSYEMLSFDGYNISFKNGEFTSRISGWAEGSSSRLYNPYDFDEYYDLMQTDKWGRVITISFYSAGSGGYSFEHGGTNFVIVGRDQPTHTPLTFCIPHPSVQQWEKSTDDGATWISESGNTSSEYTEQDPSEGKILYRAMLNDGSYTDIIPLFYYDTVPEEIAATSASEFRTVDESVTFSINHTDHNDKYQWYHDGQIIPDATEQTYTISAVKAADAGSYTCLVSNEVSSTTSSATVLTVNKCPQNIEFPEFEVKTFGDEAITLPQNTSKGLPITYQSTNQNVATVNGNVLTIVGVGETNIVAANSGNADYLAAPTVTRKLVVNKKSNQITFNPLPEKTYEDLPFALTAVSSQDLPVSYRSVNTEVATIEGNTLTIHNAGTTEIIATQEGNATVNEAAPVTQILTVKQRAQTINFGPIEPKTFGDPDILLNETTDKNLTITYVCDNLDVATIEGNVVKIKHPGSAKITASQEGNRNYLGAQTVSQVLTVQKANQIIALNDITGNKYGDADIILPEKTDKGLTISYTTGDENIAIINEGNKLHITGAGTTIVTATQTGDEYYNEAASVTINFSVEKAYQTITFPEIGDVIYGCAPLQLQATSDSSTPVTYKSDNTNVATINGDQLNIVGAGSCYITAYAEGDNNYYAATPVSRQLTVARAQQSLIFDSVEDKTYGDAPFNLEATSSQNLPIVFTSSSPAVISINGNQALIKGAGQVTITATQEGNGNFEAVSASISLNVNKAHLIVSANNAERVYGDENPKLTLSFTGFCNGDTRGDLQEEPTATCSATIISPIGAYNIIAEGGQDKNYEIEYRNGVLTVGKAPLTVIPNDATKIYGDKSPELGYTMVGFKNGEDEDVLINRPTTDTECRRMSDVGEYAITAQGGEARNYEITYKQGRLSVVKATLTVTLADMEREYGLDKSYEVTYSGFKGDDTQDDLDVLPSVQTDADRYSDVGKYRMSLLGGNDNNYAYDFHYNNGNVAYLNITKAPLTVKADDKTFYTNETFPQLSMTFEGFRNDDIKDDIDVWPNISCGADQSYPAGKYPIYLTGGSDNNYDLILNDGVLTIIEGDAAVTDIEVDKDDIDLHIYNMQGQFIKVLKAGTYSCLRDELEPGFYIINRHKVLVK